MMVIKKHLLTFRKLRIKNDSENRVDMLTHNFVDDCKLNQSAKLSSSKTNFYKNLSVESNIGVDSSTSTFSKYKNIDSVKATDMIRNIKPSMFSGTLDRSSKADGICADIKQDKELQHIPIYNIDHKDRSPIIKEDEAFQCPLKCKSRTRWSDASHLATYHNFKSNWKWQTNWPRHSSQQIIFIRSLSLMFLAVLYVV